MEGDLPNNHSVFRMPKVQHRDKLQIVRLYEEGWKRSSIRRIMAKENVDYYTYSNIRYVIDQHCLGNLSPVTTVSTKPPSFKKICQEDIETIQTVLGENCNMSSRDIQRVLQEKNVNTSLTTVRKAIDAAGFVSTKPRYCQLIRDVNKAKRVDFCKELITSDEKFKDVIFTDETSIQLHDNKTVAYRQKDAVAPNHCRPKHALKVHLWGGISKRGATKLLVFDGIMCADFYAPEILGNTLLPFIRKVYPEGHRFMQDNDPKHTSNLAKEFMQVNGINWWKWPSESCDLNPIEMIWNALKRNVSKRSPTTKDQLVQYAMDCWEKEITPATCAKYIDHIYKVVPVVIAVDGRATADLPRKLFPESSEGKGLSYFHSQIQHPCIQQKLNSLIAKEFV